MIKVSGSGARNFTGLEGQAIGCKLLKEARIETIAIQLYPTFH